MSALLEAAFTRYAYGKAGLLDIAQAEEDRPPDDYEPWLATLFPSYATAPLAERHHDLWSWLWALDRGIRPRPFVGLWPRGGAKSTTAELGCVAAGARGTRKYTLYVSGKQAQADDHVQNVANMLESPALARYYPAMSERLVGKYGNSQGWRRNRVRTASGFTVDAIGLDVAARGVKLDEARPDLLIFDDVDDSADSIETTKKKIVAITHKILPAGSNDVATLFIQNVVHYESIAARLAGRASEEADFLADRIVSGPYPALVGFKAERVPGTLKWRIVAGAPTWEGQDRAVCQQNVNDWGIKAFRAEAQHERTPPEGQVFPEWDAGAHVVESIGAPDPSWALFRSVDYGYAAPMCCLWGGMRPDGSIVIYRELYGRGMTAPAQAKQIAHLSGDESYRASVGDPSMWASNREGRREKSLSEQYRENGISLMKASNERIAGWSLLHTLLDFDDERAPILTVTKDCPNLIRTLPLLVKDPNKPEDADTDGEDHAPDALRYLAMKAAGHLLGAAIGASISAGWSDPPERPVNPDGIEHWRSDGRLVPGWTIEQGW